MWAKHKNYILAFLGPSIFRYQFMVCFFLIILRNDDFLRFKLCGIWFNLHEFTFSKLAENLYWQAFVDCFMNVFSSVGLTFYFSFASRISCLWKIKSSKIYNPKIPILNYPLNSGTCHFLKLGISEHFNLLVIRN